MKEPWGVSGEVPTGDIFMTCWALNESIFSRAFWEELVEKNPKAYLFFVDGDRYPIEYLRGFESVKKRKFVYEGLETPRRFTIFPLE
jgi:hypothetical protein